MILYLPPRNAPFSFILIICLYLLELASSLRLANTNQVTTMPALSVNSSSLSVLVNGVQNAIWIDGVNWHGVLSSGAGPFIRIPGCHATAWDPSRPAILYTAECLWIGLASWPANSVAGHLCRYCICWYRVSTICLYLLELANTVKNPYTSPYRSISRWY